LRERNSKYPGASFWRCSQEETLQVSVKRVLKGKCFWPWLGGSFASTMTVNCRNFVYTIGLIALCFVGIPINLNNDDVIEKEFVKFTQMHNKSYVNQPEEYARRLAYFKVSHMFFSSS